MQLHLNAEEVDELCKPLVQRRYISNILRLPINAIRPDGLPLVGRKDAVAFFNKSTNAKPVPSGFNWSK